MKISEAKSYSLLKSESGGSESSSLLSLTPGHAIQSMSKENERCEVHDNLSSVSEDISWSTDLHQKSVLANTETHENSSFIMPCSVSIPRIDLEKYVHQRDTVDFSDNTTDPLNSSSCSSFDTRTDMDGIKLEMIKRYLDNCATNFAVENENQVSFRYDKESSEISEDRKSFNLDSEENCMPLSFTKQNNIDNSTAFERNSNSCFTSVSSEHDYLNTPDIWNVSTENGILDENFKNHSKNYNLKQCSVIVKKMNVDDCLISECIKREKEALITDNLNCIEDDNLSHCSVQIGTKNAGIKVGNNMLQNRNCFNKYHSEISSVSLKGKAVSEHDNLSQCSIQTVNSLDHTKNASIKVGNKTFQNHDCFNKYNSEIGSVSLKGETYSLKPSNVFDFKSLQNKYEKEIYSEDGESEKNRVALFVESVRRRKIKMSKMNRKKCQTKNVKNGDNSFSLCKISETEQRYNTKRDRTTNQNQGINISSPNKSADFSQRKRNKILEFEKDILNAKQSDVITETKLRFTDVNMSSNGTYLGKQNILKHKEKSNGMMLNNTHEKGNKSSLESKMERTAEYQECEPYFRKYENERMIKINCIRKERKDTFMHSNRKVLNFTSSLISKNIRNDKIGFNKTGFNLHSAFTVSGIKNMNNYTLDNAEISESCENDKELKIMENKYCLKPCSVPLFKLPLSLYTMQTSEYQDSISSFCKKNNVKKENNVHYLKTKSKTSNKKCNYKFKRKQIARKFSLSVGPRKKCSMYVSRKGSFKLKPKVLPKNTKDIESCSESGVDIIECSSDVSESGVDIIECSSDVSEGKDKIWYPRYEKDLQINSVESGRFKKNTEYSILKSRKKQNMRNSKLNKKKYKPIIQEASFRLRRRKRSYTGGSEVIEGKSDASECDSDVKECHIDKTSENISDVSECDSDIKKYHNGKTLGNIETFSGNEPRKFKEEKVSPKQTYNKYRIHNFSLSKDRNLKTMKQFLEKQERCIKSGKLKNETSTESDCFDSLEVNDFKELKQKYITRLNEILDEVRGDNTFMSSKCEGNDSKEIACDRIVKFNKISTEVSGKAKVHEMNSDTFTPVECNNGEYNEHILLEELDEKNASLLRRYSIKPCVVVLEKVKLEECQSNFEDKHESPFTEKKVRKNFKSNINNANYLSIFKKAQSAYNTSLTTVKDKRLSHKDMINKENKSKLKVGVYSLDCKSGRKDMKCCSKRILKTNINKLFSTKLKPSRIRVGYNSKAFGESRKCQSGHVETAYKKKFGKALPSIKTIFEEKEVTNIENTEENLTKKNMTDNIDQYNAEREMKERLKCCEKPLVEGSLNKVKNNYESSLKNREQCKKYQFKSECNETYHENKSHCGKTLICIESICEELKEQNLNMKGELSKNGMAVDDDNDLSTLEEMTGKYSTYLESSLLGRRNEREKISVDARCKSRTNSIEYNCSSETVMNVKESSKQNCFKNECDKNEHECEYCETFVPVHMDHSKIAHNKSLMKNIRNTEENKDTCLSLNHCAVEIGKPASLIDVAERCVSFKSVTKTDVKPVSFRRRYKRLKITSSLQNTKKRRTYLINNSNSMTEYHEPVKSFEVEELKPHSLFFSRDCGSVIEISTRNRIRNRNSSQRNKTRSVYDKNLPINFDKQTKRRNIKGNDDGCVKSKYENNRVIDCNAYKVKADNSALSSPPDNDYHEVLYRREKFTCFQCGKYVHSAKGLFYHTCPGKRAIGYLCYFCERMYLSLKELELHKRIHKR